jgi:hypothetical protein
LSACLLALALFAIYNLNLRHGSGVDSIAATVQPVSIIREGSFNLDEYRTLLSTNTPALDLSLREFGGIQQRNGHLVSSYPLGAAVLAVPVFWVADRMHYLREWHHYRVVGKIAASLMVAMAAAFVFLTLRQTLSTGAAWTIALFFGLGTSAWPSSSQELWQHGPGTLCLAISAYLLVLFAKAPTWRLAFAAGLFLGLAVLCRLLNLIPVALLSCFMLFHHRKYSVAFFVPLVAIAIPLAYFNLTTYGQLSGGYAAIYQSHWHAWRRLSISGGFNNPLLQGLRDVLASPGRGLFIYSPFLIPAYVAALCYAVRTRHPLRRYFALWIILMSIMLAKNAIWWAGASFGARYFSETCVALTVCLGPLWPLLTRRRLYHAAFIASGLFSVVLNGIGAFVAPYGCSDPQSVDRHVEWLRDWRRPEFLRCVKLAVVVGPQSPEILTYKSGDVDF